MIIKNVFIPEKIGAYYLFPKRIIGFDINKTHVHATQLLLHKKTVVVEKLLEVPIENNNNAYEERASAALSTVLQQVDSYDAIHTCISSSVAIFKELRLPFLDKNKIRLIIDFEVEPLLPFSINDAVIDFIITQQHPQDRSSEVLVAAVQKQHIIAHLALFAAAGVNPDVITLDLFALYGVFKLIPSYDQLPGGTVLVDVSSYTTGIAYIHNGQLRLIRSLPKGIATQAKMIAQLLNTQPTDAMERVVRFGMEKTADPVYIAAATQAFTEFWNDIAFTLNSFTQTEHVSIGQILLLGHGADIKDLSSFVASLLHIPCEPFNINKLHNSAIDFSTKGTISQSQVTSVCVALPTPTTESFNLRRQEFSIGTDRTLLIKQLLVGCGLIFIILVALLQHDIFQIRKLQNSITQEEQETINVLKSNFKNIPPDEENLDTVVERARYEVQREEKLWFSFANPSRTSFLEYLLELTNRINQEELGFSIDKLVITEKNIIMTAHVKDHAALAILEKDLRQSKLFAHVEKVDDPDFTMKIRLS